jgi:hypothetical protein
MVNGEEIQGEGNEMQAGEKREKGGGRNMKQRVKGNGGNTKTVCFFF